MSDIATDTRAIAKRMKPWNSPSRTYASSDVPDSEYLRVTSLRLADAFEEVRADLQATQRDNAKLRKTLRQAVPVMENSSSCYTEGSTHDIAWDDARDSCVAKAREAQKGATA